MSRHSPVPQIPTCALPLTTLRWNHWKGDSKGLFERLSSASAIRTDSPPTKQPLLADHATVWFRKGRCLAFPIAHQAPAIPQCSQWCDHLAEDEPRALIVPVTDKTTHSGFIAGLCHMASICCFLPICLILNSSRRCLGSDSLLQCTHVMPSWRLSRGLSCTQASRHSCNTNKKLNQTVKKWS